jgi:hypothetical protein
LLLPVSIRAEGFDVTSKPYFPQLPGNDFGGAGVRPGVLVVNGQTKFFLTLRRGEGNES